MRPFDVVRVKTVKALSIVGLLTFFCLDGQATQQIPDVFLDENGESELETHWGYPSPLEHYFKKEKVKSPFEMMHTANYRGHVGFWTVIEKRLYLKKLLVRGPDPEDPFSLEGFSLSRLFDDSLTDQGRFADWFTGSILLRVGAYEKPLEDGTYTILYRQNRILEFTKGLLVKKHSMTGDELRQAAPELREEGKELSVHARLLKAHYAAQRSE